MILNIDINIEVYKMIDKIKKIKYSRLKEEERFFLETIYEIKPFKLDDDYQQSVFWVKNGKILLEQDFKNGYLRVNYDFIWSVLMVKYGYTYIDTQLFIKDMVERHTNLGSLTPLKVSSSIISGWKDIQI